MRMQTVEQAGRAADHVNQRLTERVPTQFNLMYSGMHEGQMLIGNGMVTNLSVAGIGIRGNHIVKIGMELALFIDLPGIEEPVCVAQSRVSWVSGLRFGVEMTAPEAEALNQLRFYVWNHLFRPPNR